MALERWIRLKISTESSPSPNAITFDFWKGSCCDGDQVWSGPWAADINTGGGQASYKVAMVTLLMIFDDIFWQLMIFADESWWYLLIFLIRCHYFGNVWPPCSRMTAFYIDGNSTGSLSKVLLEALARYRIPLGSFVFSKFWFVVQFCVKGHTHTHFHVA